MVKERISKEMADNWVETEPTKIPLEERKKGDWKCGRCRNDNSTAQTVCSRCQTPFNNKSRLLMTGADLMNGIKAHCTNHGPPILNPRWFREVDE